MRKPFTVISALLLLLIAAVHVYRALTGMELVVNGQEVPMMVSYIAAAIAGIIGLLTLDGTARRPARLGVLLGPRFAGTVDFLGAFAPRKSSRYVGATATNGGTSPITAPSKRGLI